jgi:hypothetical protein
VVNKCFNKVEKTFCYVEKNVFDKCIHTFLSILRVQRKAFLPCGKKCFNKMEKTFARLVFNKVEKNSFCHVEKKMFLTSAFWLFYAQLCS